MPERLQSVANYKKLKKISRVQIRGNRECAVLWKIVEFIRVQS